MKCTGVFGSSVAGEQEPIQVSGRAHDERVAAAVIHQSNRSKGDLGMNPTSQ